MNVRFIAILAFACSSACIADQISPMPAYEIAAIQKIRTIVAAEINYYTTNDKYADSLAVLGAAGLIPSKLVSGEGEGYTITLAAKSKGFVIHADPKVFGKTGRRTFYCTDDGVIHQNRSNAPATENSPKLEP